ncbi:DUF3788 family protein [Anaerobaca lacustris]|uniref:DUF3788 family protein n=1 Tax=Anaerobaca lacustris TaxID=3044600 RepID=A0AAW6U294_9BACT|nr:DUF3788 family protein [Sedimentisphaerales bacterium M17dextr]
MEKPCLSNPDQFPDDEVLSGCLGKAKAAWDSFLSVLVEGSPAFAAEWRYYRDGKSWLYKVTKTADLRAIRTLIDIKEQLK